jgi:uncharacterized membrane protein YeaQ/YmgE (transglycosylase-associated protein family)
MFSNLLYLSVPSAFLSMSAGAVSALAATIGSASLGYTTSERRCMAQSSLIGGSANMLFLISLMLLIPVRTYSNTIEPFFDANFTNNGNLVSNKFFNFLLSCMTINMIFSGIVGQPVARKVLGANCIDDSMGVSSLLEAPLIGSVVLVAAAKSPALYRGVKTLFNRVINGDEQPNIPANNNISAI